MAQSLNLAAVPLSTELDDLTAANPRPCESYRDSIRSVAISGNLSRIGNTTSSYSSSDASASYASSYSGLASAAAVPWDVWAFQLREIACRMVGDGYTQRVVQAFDDVPDLLACDDRDGALERLFFELDVDWVLQIRDEHHALRQLEDKLESSLQQLVDRWIRALTVIYYSISDLRFRGTLALSRFCKASITKMLVFVDAIVPAACHSPAEKLHSMVNIFGCVCDANDFFVGKCQYLLITNMYLASGICEETCIAVRIYEETYNDLYKAAYKLHKAVESTMEEVRKLMKADGSWETEISRGGGEVHKNTRIMVDYAVLLGGCRRFDNGQESQDRTLDLHGTSEKTIDYLNFLISIKSQHCPDPSLRYLFLLNNFHFVGQQVRSLLPWAPYTLRFPLETTEGYIDNYFNASWAPVLSCISTSNPGPLHWWNKTSSLAKFKSKFHKTYQAQKFWKVPNPELRNRLRRTITERVISGYRKYLQEHRELVEYASRESSSPDDMEEMLGLLFEG